MENKTIPFLCGGTFFIQILRARRRRKSPAELAKGQKESLSEPELFRRLISIYQLTDFYSAGSSLKTNASHFKQCQDNLIPFIEFNDYDKRRNFDEDIQKKDSKAFSAMIQFIRDFIDESVYVQLTRNLLGLIQEDSSIPANENFFIWPEWVEKRNLITRTEISLPDFLLGIWCFIATKRSAENVKGADTYRSWYPDEKNKYMGNVGSCIEQKLQVTCNDAARHLVSASVLDGENNQGSEKDHETSNASDTEEDSYSKTQIIQNATIVNQHGETNLHINHVDTLNL